MHKSLLLFFLSLFIPFSLSFAQENEAIPPAKNLMPEMLKDAYQDAIKNIESEKKEEEKKITSELKSKLQDALQQWIDSAGQKMGAKLNQLTVPDWNDVPQPQPNLPYAYYVRGFNYSILSTDISKTESYTNPFIAVAKLQETLYVEKDHSPSSSYPKEYLYTVITPFTLTLESTQDSFEVTGETRGDMSIEPGWPQEQQRALKVIE